MDVEAVVLIGIGEAFRADGDCQKSKSWTKRTWPM